MFSNHQDTARRARWVDGPTALALLVLIGLAAFGLRGAIAGVGQPFPGFLVLENRVVASVGLSIWPATADGQLFQREIFTADGARVDRAQSLVRRIRSLPVGTEVTYRLRGTDGEITRNVATRLFGWSDFLLLHGLYLLNGFALGLGALVAMRRRHDPAARACLPLLATGAVWVLTALDLYGPYHLFRIHALAEAMLFPAALMMALYFPTPSRLVAGLPGVPTSLYVLAGALAVAYQTLLRDPTGYVWTHLIAISAFGLALVALVVAEVERLRRPMSLQASDRLRVAILGAVTALAVPIAFTAAEWITGGRSPQNALAITGAIFPLALAWALTREDSALRPKRVA